MQNTIELLGYQLTASQAWLVLICIVAVGLVLYATNAFRFIRNETNNQTFFQDSEIFGIPINPSDFTMLLVIGIPLAIIYFLATQPKATVPTYKIEPVTSATAQSAPARVSTSAPTVPRKLPEVAPAKPHKAHHASTSKQVHTGALPPKSRLQSLK